MVDPTLSQLYYCHTKLHVLSILYSVLYAYSLENQHFVSPLSICLLSIHPSIKTTRKLTYKQSNTGHSIWQDNTGYQSPKAGGSTNDITVRCRDTTKIPHTKNWTSIRNSSWRWDGVIGRLRPGWRMIIPIGMVAIEGAFIDYLLIFVGFLGWFITW